MLWKKPWELESVLALVAGIVASFLFGNVAAGLLRGYGVDGFKSDDSFGSVLLATFSFQGVAIVLGTLFLRAHGSGWGDVLGATAWKRSLGLALAVLVIITPLIFGLEAASEFGLEKLGWQVEKERAVDLVLNARTPWLSAYLAIYAVILAPLGEEFFFRGLLFSTAKRFGRPKLGWIGVSLLFALAHFNAPTFLSLFVLALALTWLYVKTEGLLAPVLAHGLFNLGNLIMLMHQKYSSSVG